MTSSDQPGTKAQQVNWPALLAPYMKPSSWRSSYQLVNTAVPFVLLWLVMLWCLRWSYLLTILLALPAAFLMVRLFIFQHDCGHHAFFKARRANDTLGFILGILTLVPYAYWKRTHAIHHSTSGNLDHRDFGDIDTLTVREYLALSKFKRFRYRLYRHPLVLLFVGPTYQFVLKQRYPSDIPRSWKREWAAVHGTNVALLGVIGIMTLTVGLDRFLLVQAPITLISASVGMFLFYVQHQYEHTYWRYREGWNYYDAGLKGSSHLVLPKWLQWCTGNIGLHHIHHVCSRIPNYYLQRCIDELPELQNAIKLRPRDSIKTLTRALWDEDERRLVPFREVRAIRARLAAAGGPAGLALRPTKPEVTPRAWR